MKGVVILGIAVAVIAVVGGILFIDQNNQIVMMKNQKMLEDEVRYCGAQYMFYIPNMDKCFLNAFETFGTQDQLNNYIQAKRDSRQAEKNAAEFREFAFAHANNWCREHYIGQLDELTRCLERNQIEFGY
jgi:hypothetical protein